MSKTMRKTFIFEIKEIITQSRRVAIRNVDFQRVLMYWHIGKSIFEEEQHSKERADMVIILSRTWLKNWNQNTAAGFRIGNYTFAFNFRHPSKTS